MAIVDVAFRVQGSMIPADHGYLLYSAISRILPEIHEKDGFGLHPISGRLVGERRLALTDRSSLTIRLDSDEIVLVLPLAGKRLKIGESEVTIGISQTRALIPAVRLVSRLVIIKGFMDPEPFLAAAKRQLDSLNIKGVPGLLLRKSASSAEKHGSAAGKCPYIRRTLRIRDKEVVGYAMEVSELTAEESILLQEIGLGGRRRFGCGLFVPVDKRG